MVRQSCLAASVLALLAGPALAQAPAPTNQCFFISEFENWKPGGDEQIMYIRITGRRFYRLDLANRCSEMSWPGATMINKFRGDTVCSSLDWDMRVSQGSGSAAAPCIVKKMTRLSDAEAAALPAKQKP